MMGHCEMPAKKEGLVAEVREFLHNLTTELPLIFSPASAKPKPERRLKTLPYRGRDVALCVIEAPELRRSEIARDDDVLVLRRGADRAEPQTVLRKWLIDRARETFIERAAYWAPRLGVGYRRLSIRDQRTVWGSCTKAGDLNFNWRLIMASCATFDYLVIHELAHLREMNHSKRFWAHVQRHCPDWRRHRRWLREHSRRLKTAVRRAS